MRIHAFTAVGVLLLSITAFADGMSQAEREASLVPLDELIPPETQALIDAQRPLIREKIEGAMHSSAAHGVDLRFRDTPVKKQFGGTCTAFGLIGAMENLLGGAVQLSERHLWSQYGKFSAKSAIRTASRGYGVVEERWWPQSSLGPRPGYLEQPWYKLTQYEYYGADLSKIMDSLDRGDPVYAALSTPKDMMACSTHIDPESPAQPNSGHAVAVVGYQADSRFEGGGAFLVKNSWGTKCGDQGYQWFPFSLCLRDGMYCVFWSIQGVAK